MYGQITKFHRALNAGVIHADDGSKYRFSKAQILNATEELIGKDVDFMIVGRQPKEIIMMAGSAWSAFGPIRHA